MTQNDFHPAALFVCAKSLSKQISDLADGVLYFTSGALEITQNDFKLLSTVAAQ